MSTIADSQLARNGGAFEALKLKEKVGYGMGDAGSCIVWSMLALYLTWFYTDVFGLAPEVVAILFLFIRIFDAFTDPLMGSICDHTVSRYGKFRPYLLYLAVPFGVGAVIMFTTPNFGPTGKLIYAYLTYFVMSLIYTGINIPYCSVLGNMTLNERERMSCLSWRFFLNGLATLIVTSSILPLSDYLGSGNRAQGFQYSMMILGTLGALMFLCCFSFIKERVQAPRSSSSFFADVKHIVHNDQWLLMIFLTFVNVFPAFIRGAVTIYFATYIMHASTAFITFFMTIGVVCNMIGSVVAKPLTDRFDKVKLFRVINVVLGVLSLWLYFIDPNNLYLLIPVFVVINILHLVQSGPILWGMMSDVDDYGEYKLGRRLTGISFAGNLFMLKLGLAIAGSIVAWVLAYTGYIANEPQQNEATLSGITIMFSLMPMACYFLSAIMVSFFKLDAPFLAKIKAELAQRNVSNNQSVQDTQTLSNS